VDVNLSRLERFVDRELYFRHTAEEPPGDGLSTGEVVDEVIVQALSDGARPEKLALEPWLYRLAMQAMDDMSARLNDLESPIHLEDSRRRQNVEASDEAVLQFHQPDEGWTKESSIPDRRLTTPEQATYSDEMVGLVQAALRGADRIDREAFLLYGIEGFSLAEIAVITARNPEAVRESISRARAQVRNAPAMANEFPRQLIKRTAT
jgi:RNA polymerase sigma factor (sigma-70 family)